MDRYSLQESMSGADNEEEETVGSSEADSATDPVLTPPPPEVSDYCILCMHQQNIMFWWGRIQPLIQLSHRCHLR